MTFQMLIFILAFGIALLIVYLIIFQGKDTIVEITEKIKELLGWSE